MKLSDLNILDIGNKIRIAGMIYSDNENIYLVPLPDEIRTNQDLFDYQDLVGCFNEAVGSSTTKASLLEMNADDWQRFLYQTDVLEVEGLEKVILRKSQRQVAQFTAWEVFRRDEYRCRYCGRNDQPLTVDHIDLWQHGGSSEKDNLLSTCRKCNKTRGDMLYEDWLKSDEYKQISQNLSIFDTDANKEILAKLSELRSKRTSRQRTKRK